MNRYSIYRLGSVSHSGDLLLARAPWSYDRWWERSAVHLLGSVNPFYIFLVLWLAVFYRRCSTKSMGRKERLDTKTILRSRRSPSLLPSPVAAFFLCVDVIRHWLRMTRCCVARLHLTHGNYLSPSNPHRIPMQPSLPPAASNIPSDSSCRPFQLPPDYPTGISFLFLLVLLQISCYAFSPRCPCYH